LAVLQKIKRRLLGAFFSAVQVNPENLVFATLKSPKTYRNRSAYVTFESLKEEPDLVRLVENDIYPLPVTDDREGYHGECHYDYWLSGLLDYLLVKQRAYEHGLKISQTSRVFDFGCASGRVLRHFCSQEPGLELWGSDLNVRHIEWIRRYLAPDIKIFQNGNSPSLPVADNYFDCVYAFSVFSHIDFLEHAWLLELNRILKPGGIAYLTVHTENTWEIMDETIPVYNALLKRRGHIIEYEVTPSFLATRPMPERRMVFTYRTANGYRNNIFLSTEYLQENWGRFFESIHFYRAGHHYQDVVLLKKA